jgi:hypothetical protein
MIEVLQKKRYSVMTQPQLVNMGEVDLVFPVGFILQCERNFVVIECSCPCLQMLSTPKVMSKINLLRRVGLISVEIGRL